MNNFTRNSLLAFACIVVCFLAIILYAARRMPVMTTESKRVLTAFFVQIKAKDYEGARQFLGSNAREEVSTEKLKSKWQKFESSHGAFQQWAAADADSKGGGRICLWPPYVDYFVRASGAKGDEILYFRVAPQGQNWKIERYSEFRQNPR